MRVCSLFSHVRLSAAPWTVPARLLCPWDFPGKNTGAGCHFQLQGTFLTQRSNPRLLLLLHWEAGSLLPYHQGSEKASIDPSLSRERGRLAPWTFPTPKDGIPELIVYQYYTWTVQNFCDMNTEGSLTFGVSKISKN